jgi:hypothetical protein
MLRKQHLLIAATVALVGKLVGCSSDKDAGITPEPGTGGVANGSGSSTIAAGGSSTAAATAGGTSGSLPGSGTAIGGTSTAASSVQHETGGALGTTSKSAGGTSSATGGSVAAGGTRSVAGGSLATGSTSLAKGGSTGVGGNSGATESSLANGGVGPAAGGALPNGGAGTGGTTAVDPSVSAAINACIDKLPYGGNSLSADKRAPIVTAIINTCTEFAPPGAEWQTYCRMFLASAINAESSYDTQAGTQGAGSDPSVGLLQIRFSSVVRDFADFGPVKALTRIGCNFGTVTDSDSFATKRDMMLDVNCNIAIAAWYYFIFASGNGGDTVVWVYDYCSGGGVAGNLHIGIASFLMGGDAAHSSLSGADFYYNEIKGWFDQCVTYTGTHPFELTIQPDMRKYCG